MLPCPICRPLSTTPDIATSDRNPSACRPPAPDPQSTDTATAAPVPSLRSTWRHNARAVTNDSACRLQRTCAESAAGVLSGFLSNRSLAKARVGMVESEPPTERWQDKSDDVAAVASRWTRKRFASWGRKACSCARSPPPQAQKRQVLECPVLYRSGAPEEIRTPDPQIRSFGHAPNHG